MDDRPSPEEDLLARWFEARDRGEETALEGLCSPSEQDLLPEVRRLLGHQALVDAALRPMAATEPRGPRIPGLETIALLGRGGMGEVWLARDPSLSRLIAVKVLPPAGQDPKEFIRIRREAEVTASLDHPNIVPVHAFGETEGLAWIAMRWLGGPSLDHLEGPLEPMAVARIGAAVARALHAAHEAGVIHRDVKPANVILDEGTPYVVDFGLARSLHHPSLTASHATPGTLLYMPPERLGPRGSLPDPRGDVYGLGATLYQLLKGRPPFPPADPIELVRAILERDPPAIGLRGAGRDLEAVVFRALEKDPAHRYRTAETLAEDLERFLDGRAVSARRFGWFRRSARRIGRHPRTAAAVGVLALAAGASSAAWWVSTSTSSARRDAVLESARRAIAADRFADAEARLESLDPNDPLVREYAAVLDGCRALEDLLDAVLARPEDQSPAVLRGLLARVDATSPAARPARGTHLAAALALFMLGDTPSARARVEAADAAAGEADLPASVALRALLDEATGVVLPSAPPADLLELAVAVQGLRLLGVGDATRATYIEAAAARRGDPRAQFLSAIDFIDQGEFAVAREKLEDLEMAGRRTAGTDILLSWVAVLEGNREEAARILEAIGARTDALPPRAAVLAAMLDLSSSGREAARARLAEALLRWPRDPLIRYNLALLEEGPGARISALTELGASGVGGALASAAVLVERYRALMEGAGAGGALREDRQMEASALMRDIEAFAGSCRHAHARSTALVVRAGLMNRLSRDGLSVLAAALLAFDAEPRNPRAVAMVAEVAKALGASVEPETAARARSALERVRPALQRMARGSHLGPWPTSDGERKVARTVLSDR